MARGINADVGPLNPDGTIPGIYIKQSTHETCFFCGKKGWLGYRITDDLHEDYVYVREYLPMSGYEEFVMCEPCLIKLEIGFVKKLSMDQLPIYVNHPWLTPKATKAYKKRFGG